MPYVKKNLYTRCSQMLDFDDIVDDHSIARVIDKFIDELDISGYNIKEVAKTGRPQYDPKSMFKLFLYGYSVGIRSSRKLAYSCKDSIVFSWLMQGLEPDFRTIADFRKNNIESLTKLFREYVDKVSDVETRGYVSIDGSKIQASNSKDRNFTMSKLDDRLQRLANQGKDLLEQDKILDDEELEESGMIDPKKLTKEELDEKLKSIEERKALYESYRDELEKSGESQKSLTDPDSRLMKNKNGFGVGFNPQTAVDSETHLITNFEMTNSATDHGQLLNTAKPLKDQNPDKILELTADKGYIENDDMVACLENGIIPNVIPDDDASDGFDLETAYKKSNDVKPESTKPEELKKCIQAGIVPDVYKDVIKDVKVRDKKEFVRDNTSADEPKRTDEEMLTRAAEGYFERDAERNLVYCPAGNILRQKSIKKNGDIRYYNRLACKKCPYRNKCITGSGAWKEIDFNKDTLEKPCRPWLKEQGKKSDAEICKERHGHYEHRKIVCFHLLIDRHKTENRKCLSEHPFGTIKRAMGGAFFLLRGMKKVTGEFALLCTGYNIKRSLNVFGYKKVMEMVSR